MRALFVELPAFSRYRQNYLNDGAFRALQLELLANPEVGDVIEGTGGLRKMRQGEAGRFAGYLLLVGTGQAVLAVHLVQQERSQTICRPQNAGH